MTSEARKRAVEANNATWKALVDMATEFRRNGTMIDVDALAAEMKKSTGSLTAKFNAILAALGDGAKPEQVIEEGEAPLLKRKAQKRAAAAPDGTVPLTFRVDPKLKEDVLEAFDRVQSVIGCGTRENVLDIILSILMHAEDEDIRHLAGEGRK